jgi:hypothetical protein
MRALLCPPADELMYRAVSTRGARGGRDAVEGGGAGVMLFLIVLVFHVGW